MRKAWRSALKHTGAGTVIALGLVLIAISILSGAGISSIDGLLSSLQTNRAETAALPPDIPAVSDEVRNYVLFTHVKFGTTEVVTGTEYLSTGSREIDHQWCYLTGDAKPGGAFLRLDLARKPQRGPVAITRFTSESLKSFDLSDEAARGLVTTHCRFR